jgi:phosphoribosylglycinamide formyltransferase-1
MRQTQPLRVAILISGGGTNLQAIIDEQQAGRLPVTIVGVLSDNPEAKGLQRAKTAGIPAVTVPYQAYSSRPKFDAALDQALADLAPELVVLAGFMRILPDDLVNQYNGRMLNIHPSLLPKYPGLHTYKRVLDARDEYHGTTVHFVIPQLDAGPAILQYRVKVSADETETSLAERVQSGEYTIYPRCIGWIAERRLELRDDKVWLDDKPLSDPIIIDDN